jgi:galactitol PTS system EIIB component
MKKILVACGNGVATSTVAGIKIREACEAAGLNVTITQCKLAEIESKAENFDLVVTTGVFDGKSATPVVRGMAFLTGMGVDQTINEIIEKVK